MDIEKLKFLSFLGKIKVWSLIFNKMFDAYLETYFFPKNKSKKFKYK